MKTISESTKVTLTIGQIKRLIAETMQPIDETGLALGGKIYPPSDNVLILAGGAGSGKGLVRNKVLFFDGKVFDVDDLKALTINYGKFRPNDPLAVDFKDRFGYSLADVDLKNPQHVSDVHEFVELKDFSAKRTKAFFKGLKDNTAMQKPNVIFDVTMKDLKKFKKCCKTALDAGYDKKNIHLVWVVNSFAQAIANNASRDRSVSQNILFDTHTGVAMTMNDIIGYTKHIYLNSWLDGDVWIVFAKNGDDIIFKKSELVDDPDDSKVPKVLEDFTAYQLKKQGEPMKPYKYVEDWVKHKLAQYLPHKVKYMFKQ